MMELACFKTVMLVTVVDDKVSETTMSLKLFIVKDADS